MKYRFRSETFRQFHDRHKGALSPYAILMQMDDGTLKTVRVNGSRRIVTRYIPTYEQCLGNAKRLAGLKPQGVSSSHEPSNKGPAA